MPSRHTSRLLSMLILIDLGGLLTLVPHASDITDAAMTEIILAFRCVLSGDIAALGRRKHQSLGVHRRDGIAAIGIGTTRERQDVWGQQR